MVKDRLKLVKAKKTHKSYYKSIAYETASECYPDIVECYPDVLECYPDGIGMLSRRPKSAVHRPEKGRLIPLKWNAIPTFGPSGGDRTGMLSRRSDTNQSFVQTA